MPIEDEETTLLIADIQPYCEGFSIDKKIGIGGQKEVFRGSNSEDIKVVIKLVKIDYFWFGNQTIMRDVDAEQRALREIELIKNYSSPYLPSLYSDEIDYVVINGFTYLKFIENYAGDESLHDMINARGSLDVATVTKMINHVTQALSLYASDGIVHRDIKPQNIVYNQEHDRFVLIDGGVHLSPMNGTLSVDVVGTRPFFSPEQANGKRRELDSRSDLFALGITAYCALARMHPFAVGVMSKEQFEYNRANAVYPKLSADEYGERIVAIIDRLLQKYPHARYRNPDALLLELNKEEE